MNARALLSLLFNAQKGLDVVQTALDLGIAARLDAGPVTLAELAAATGAKPNRLYKFLDCLESMGLVVREQNTDDRLEARYRSVEHLEDAARAVLGPQSIERDRDRYDWRRIHGELPAVLRGERSIESFDWPPRTQDQVEGFEASMAAGARPIVESFLGAKDVVFAGATRWLDVGGGDGAVAAGVLPHVAGLGADVFNLEATRDLTVLRARREGLEHRLGFAAGDFFQDPLPRGYDVVSFVRVLHDWDERRAAQLLAKGRAALDAGGTLVVCEEFRTHERLAVQFFWTYFLMGVDGCESRLREVEFYVRELSRLGFSEVRVVPGAFDLVVARV